MAKAYVFPGQGSQVKGMGEGLFAKYPELVAQADALLGYSLAELCLADPHEQLGQTRYTQPALYAVNALMYLDKLAGGAPRPDFLAGHSLGEYDALFAAGAFDFVTGLKLVQRRGEIMSAATGGGMAAILGMNADQVHQVIADHGLTTIDVANYNAPTQIVISGLKADIEAAQAAFEAAGAKRYIPLKVSGAFHSRHMSAAAASFGEFLAGFTFQPLQVPVIANLTAAPYEQDRIAETLRQQIDHSVRWVDSIVYLQGQGEVEFEEVGPGKVLTSLIRQIR